MKKLLLISAGLLAATAAFGQGTFNAFNGFRPGGAGTPFAFINDYAPPGVTPVPLAGGAVQILTADGLTVLASGTTGTGGTAGIFSLGVTTIPNAPAGGAASVLIRSWDTTTGATFDSALERKEVLVSWTSIAAPPSPPSTMAQSNFTGMTLEIVPEPSTVALAALGVAGLFFVARRKK